jgi:hypothetical protein
MRVRKKAIEVEAWQFDPSNIKDMLVLQQNYPNQITLLVPFERGDPEVWVDTLEGRMTAKMYDWIIKGVKGELYPCDNEVFEATYDILDESYHRVLPPSVSRGNPRANQTG